MPRNYENGTPAYVNLARTGTVLKYGYRCRLQSATAYTDLGITKLDPATITEALLLNFVLGCNAPKPNRASKIFTSVEHGSESSFISSASIASARTNGWKVSPAKRGRKVSASNLSEVWYVTINGMKYAWVASKVPPALAAKVNLADIGIKVAASGDDDLIFGCSFPKPARAEKVLNDNGDTFSSFVDPSVATLPAGWQVANDKKSNRYKLDDLRGML